MQDEYASVQDEYNSVQDGYNEVQAEDYQNYLDHYYHQEPAQPMDHYLQEFQDFYSDPANLYEVVYGDGDQEDLTMGAMMGAIGTLEGLKGTTPPHWVGFISHRSSSAVM